MRWYILPGVLFFTLAINVCSAAQDTVQVTATNLPPSTTTNVRAVQTVNLNLFRYNAQPNVQDKTSNPPTPPVGIMPPATGGGGTPNRPSAAVSPPGAAAPGPPATGADPLEPLEEAIKGEEMSLSNLTATTQDLLNNAKLATACFNDIQGRYPQLLLTPQQRTALVNDLNNATNCALPTPQWPASNITAAINTGPATSNLFIQLSAAVAAEDPKGTLLTRHITAQTALVTLLTSTGAATLATANVYIGAWQLRRTATISATDAQWSPTVALTCHPQWFGKTEQQVVSILYYDMTASTPSQQSMTLLTNSCLAALTITSGLGFSTVRSSIFAFTPKTNKSVSPPTTTQVIGYASDSRVVPLYLGAMNYEFARAKGLGFDVAGGVGVSSSSAGTTSDFFLGPSFAFARRAIFVSPSFHLTQRQTLQDGYAVGDAQGSLTSVPTINRWRYGFALTFTFPILQAQ
jgi:hypothetical protein